MDFIGTWLDTIMGVVSLMPKLVQCCTSFGGAMGFVAPMGCTLASCSQMINAIHCIECWGLSFDNFIVPMFEKMWDEIRGVFAK